jgi:farnesyl-diphosphate farnesyltransferase
MLTELFCAHDPAMARQRAGMRALATSFAQGLQMTNILKDVWEDRSRGACWLPQEVFSRYGVDLATLSPQRVDARFAAGMRELVGVTHAHLRDALAYTLLIPAAETGIRRFCLWALGLAVLTLRKIDRNPQFTAGVQVKVSRSTVAMTQKLTTWAVGSDWLLRRLFDAAARGLPLAPPGAVTRAVSPLASEPVQSTAPAPVAGGVPARHAAHAPIETALHLGPIAHRDSAVVPERARRRSEGGGTP